jgi:hypothetical protein
MVNARINHYQTESVLMAKETDACAALQEMV